MSSALASVLAPESPRKPRASGIFCFQSLGVLLKLALKCLMPASLLLLSLVRGMRWSALGGEGR